MEKKTKSYNANIKYLFKLYLLQQIMKVLPKIASLFSEIEKNFTKICQTLSQNDRIPLKNTKRNMFTHNHSPIIYQDKKTGVSTGSRHGMSLIGPSLQLTFVSCFFFQFIRF